MKRRKFLQLLPAGLILGSSPGSYLLSSTPASKGSGLTILHSNDWHSRIEAFPMDGSRNQGLGGAAKRAALIKKIREEEENVLLFDSGDIFQGTPYFNYFTGELEIKLMSKMGYDAATIGNHDFDGGIENLAVRSDEASFPFLNANYDFGSNPMRDQVRDYTIFNKNGIRVGVFGVGIELDGLVPDKLTGHTKYMDPVERSNKIADHLRSEEKCDLVVCLSHLGYKYKNARISDVVLAQKTRNIDIILGGHTHTFMKQPDEITNEAGKSVLINQVGWGGILLGRIDIAFQKVTGLKKCVSSKYKI